MLTLVNLQQSHSSSFQLTLRKPFLGLGPKPTVVVDGSGQPTQWGQRTWKVSGDGALTVQIFMFNRMWKYGLATFSVEPGDGQTFSYLAPFLPFGAGKISRER